MWGVPLMLTAKDFQLIAQQCINQNATTPDEVARFTCAYEYTRSNATSASMWITSLDVMFTTKAVARIIDPRNTDFRKVPVVFANGDKGIEPNLIERQMNLWAVAFVQRDFQDATDCYKQLMQIHPFIDGNGRLGHLLWAAYTVQITKSEWPLELPPDVFNENEDTGHIQMGDDFGYLG